MAREEDGGSIGSASVWMLGLTLVLFWLPVLGPFIAGFVGGRKAGSIGAAIVAALLPAFLLAAVVVLLSTLAALPLVGILTGAALFLAIAANSLPLIVGAILGALTSY